MHEFFPWSTFLRAFYIHHFLKSCYFENFQYLGAKSDDGNFLADVLLRRQKNPKPCTLDIAQIFGVKRNSLIFAPFKIGLNFPFDCWGILCIYLTFKENGKHSLSIFCSQFNRLPVYVRHGWLNHYIQYKAEVSSPWGMKFGCFEIISAYFVVIGSLVLWLDAAFIFDKL